MTGRQDIFQQAMNQGHSAAWDQMWERAAAYYRNALAEFPDNPQALTSLGLALVELQEYDDALKCYLKASKAMPDDPTPLEKIAQLYERIGNLEKASQVSLRSAELYLKSRDVSKAIENWERVTRLVPENLQAHSRLALVYERTGEKERAVAEYLSVASILQDNGEPEKAIQAINQALKVAPNHDQATLALSMVKDFKTLPKPVRPRGGTAPLRMAQVRQLQAPEKTTSSDNSQDPVSLACQKSLTILAGMLFEGTDEEQQGRRGLQAIVSGTGMLHRQVDQTRITLHLSQLVDLQTKGEYAQAAEELQRAMDSGLDNPAASFDLGYLYARSGRLESAVRQLQAVMNHLDYALGAHLLLADVLKRKGKVSEAAVEYLQALKIADTQLVQAERANDLRQLYEPLIEAQREQIDVEVHTRLCNNIHELLMRSDWREQMLKARSQLPSQGGSDIPIPLAEMLTESRSSQMIESISSIYAMMQAGHLRSAMEEAFQTLRDAPTYLPLHSMMGEMLVKQGDLPAAAEKFQVVARTYSIRGEAQQAVSLYRRITELSPMDMNARARLIDQLTTSGMTSEAIAEYLQLADVYLSMAELNMARKTYTEALRIAQQANVERSLRIKILHRMADFDMQSLDWRQALRIYEQIRTLQPDDERARLSLVDLNLRLSNEPQALSELDDYLGYLTSNNQSAKALSLLNNLVQEYPKNIPLRRRLADYLRLSGQTTQAIAQLDTIGELLLEAGETAGAMQIIETIISLNPANKEEYLQLLSQLRGG
jgi:tetratricopeptide (TPR) repeat protein